MRKVDAHNTVTHRHSPSPGAAERRSAESSSDDKPQKVAVDAREDIAPGSSGRYERKRVLGQGGMGAVILVHDRAVGRNVALKELHDDTNDDDAQRRFAREARVQGQLEHPAIVPVYDIGSGPDGKAFFTMKRVRGELLADVLRRIGKGEPTGFSRRRLLSAFSQLCAAAHYAHERGVVHRDIKPTNVMLGAYGEVYLLDWGVAKVADDPAAPRVTAGRTDLSDIRIDAQAGLHTGFGAVMGSLSTMAPEQAVGGEIDPRTDVYALGAVLFQILTGMPFHPTGDFDEVVQAIITGVEPRPSVRAPEAEVPPELEALIVKSTRLQPADRVPSAMAMRDAVEAYLDGDRDLETRREIAKKHGDAARAAADEALGRRGRKDYEAAEEQAARASALGEVGKALALDPQNEQALGILVELLTTPPKHTPKEILLDHEENLRKNLRKAGIAGAIVYGYISLNALSTWSLGVHDVRVFALAHGVWGLSFLTSVVNIWRRSYAWLYATFTIALINCVFITVVYGPYLLVSTFITMHAVLFAFVNNQRARIVMLVLACVSWTVSVFGEHFGLFGHIVRFASGDLVIHSQVIDFPPTGTTIYLYACVLATIVAPALIVGMLRRAHHQAEMAMRLQSWQLSRLVKADERTERS
jgi:serine/threonine-protein kinase